MKKTIITIALSVAAIASSFAQGNVFFSNGNTTKISTNSIDNGAATGTAGTGLGQYYYALFFSTSQTTVGGQTTSTVGTNGAYVFNTAGWTFATGAIATNSATSGRFLSSIADATATTSIANLGAGASASFVIVGWSANIGNTVSALTAWYNQGSPATSGFIGESNPSASITTGIQGSTPTASIVGTGAGFVNPFVLGEITPTPEPATLALAGLSGASLLLFRRRK